MSALLLVLVTETTPFVPKQYTAPVANDVPWWAIALVIACAAAMISSGFEKTVRDWYKNKWTGSWAVILSESLTPLLCAGLGAIAGYQTWDAWLGALCGFLGAVAPNFFLKASSALFAVWSSRFGTRRLVNPRKQDDDQEIADESETEDPAKK